MKRYLRLSWMFLKQSLIQSTAYRLNFWMICITNLAYFGSQIIFIDIIFKGSLSLNGWSRYEMLFYIGTYNIIDALWVFGPYFNLANLPSIINSGEFDIYLTKPINSQYMASLRKIEVSSLVSLVAGICIAGYSLSIMGKTITLVRILLFTFTIVNALVLQYSLYLILTCLSFILIRADFIRKIDSLGHYFVSRPADIYKGTIKFILFYILPYGLLLVMSAKSAIKQVSIGEYLGFLAITWTFFTLSVLCWRLSLSKYSSASS